MRLSLKTTALVALAAVVLGILGYQEHRAHAGLGMPTPSALDLRPRFSLTGTDGRRVSDADLRGRPVLVTFGRVACGGPCQNLLGQEAAVLDELGAKGRKAAFLFVTLDPNRDTPDRLARFVGDIDPRLEGLRGTPAAVAAAAGAFRFEHDAGEPSPGFAVMTYLLGPQGRLRQILPDGMKAPGIAALVEGMIDEG